MKILSVTMAGALLVAEFVTSTFMQEYCLWTGIIPASLRMPYYNFLAVLAAVSLGAWFLPTLILQIMAGPASLGLTVFILRRHPAVMSWVVRSCPEAMRPAVTKVMESLLGNARP